jgi:hypothetical protein
MPLRTDYLPADSGNPRGRSAEHSGIGLDYGTLFIYKASNLQEKLPRKASRSRTGCKPLNPSGIVLRQERMKKKEFLENIA